MSRQHIIVIPDSNHVLAEQCTQSILIVRHILREVVKRSQSILSEHHIEGLIPKYVPLCLIQMAEDTLSLGIQEPDEYMTERISQGIVEESEPKSKIEDCWRSYIANVDLKLPLQSQSSNSLSKTHFSHNQVYQGRVSVKIDPQKKKKSIAFEPYEPILVDKSIPLEDDPLENGLRQNLEREHQLRDLKAQAEQQRLQEKREQQKQIRMIANSLLGNKAYTFDNEGRFIVQTIPKQETLAPMYNKPHCEVKFQEKNVKIDFGRSFTKNEIKAEKIKTVRQDIQFAPKFDLNLIDSVEVAKGVTVHQGLSTKVGPSFRNDFLRYLSTDSLSSKLQDPSLPLKMTKNEYQTLVTRKLNFGKQVSIDESQVLTTYKGQDTSMVNQSRKRLNSSIDTVLGGSIKINNELNASVEDLLVNEVQEQKAMLLPKLVQQASTNKPISLQARKEPIKQSKPILPKVMNTQHSLPILPKNPRDRILSQTSVSQSNSTLRRLMLK